MAQIPYDRPRLMGGQYLQQNLKVRFPTTFTGTAYPGDGLTYKGGQFTNQNSLTGTSTATNSAGSLGAICEQYLIAPTANDPIWGTIVMPYIFYDISMISSVTQASTGVIGRTFPMTSISASTDALAAYSGSQLGFGLGTGSSTDGNWKAIYAKPYEDQYITHTVLGANDTVAQAGSTHYPSIDSGKVTDAGVRLACFNLYNIWNKVI